MITTHQISRPHGGGTDEPRSALGGAASERTHRSSPRPCRWLPAKASPATRSPAKASTVPRGGCDARRAPTNVGCSGTDLPPTQATAGDARLPTPPLMKRLMVLIIVAATLTITGASRAVTFPYSDSWLGADGGYSVALTDHRSVWAFSDTIDGARHGQLHFVHNSLVVFSHGHTRVIKNVLSNLPDGSYFWPLAMRQRDDGYLWMLAARIKDTGTGIIPSRYVETWLVRVDTRTWRVVRRDPVPGTRGGVTWGVGTFDADCLTYIYGVTADGLHVATVPLGRLDTPWRFKGRVLNEGFSNGVSLLKTPQGLRLVAQQSALDPHVYSWRATSPAGPFSGKHVVHDTGTFPGSYTYNTLAHPEEATRQSMLLSFNVNRFGPLSCDDTPLYRPRLVRVPLGRF